ncbi:MAG TPA: S41 family peptidase [Chitinophagaceae bacterium]|nr:S41 family peptidase [Chitinophagaceae bacterium]
MSLKPGLTSSGVKMDSVLSNQQIKNLFALGRIWGFLKYYHPDVAKGRYSFDSCLFSILPPLLQTQDNVKRDELLLNWISTLGDENKYVTAAPVDESNLISTPKLDWLNDRSLLSENLARKLKNIYLHRNTDSNYYVTRAEEGNPNFSRELSYKSMAAEDGGMRMLALFRYWNIIEYFFPYKHLFKEDWANVLKEFLPQFASNRTPLDYRLTCWRLINNLHDTHASIYRDSLLNNWTGMKGPAIDFKIIDKKVIVRDYLDDSLAKLETVKPGDEITAVNGRSIKEIRAKFDPYICASNMAAADRNFLWRFLFFGNEDSLIVTYERHGSIQKGTMHLYYRPPFRNGDTWRLPMYKLLADDIGYINIGKVHADSLPAIFKKFDHTKGIIIDIRNYPTQFMPFAMGRYLKPTCTPFVKYTGPDFNYPGAFRVIGFIKNGASDTDRVRTYNGVVVILVNEQTQSSAEFTAMALRSAPHAVVIGSQTAGADGDISYVPFPGGFYSPFSGLGIYYPGGKDTQGVGIVPDIFAYPTQHGIADGKDEVLEKAKEYIRTTKAF